MYNKNEAKIVLMEESNMATAMLLQAFNFAFAAENERMNKLVLPY